MQYYIEYYYLLLYFLLAKIWAELDSNSSSSSFIYFSIKSSSIPLFNKSILISGKNIFNTIPGKPAPVPISQIYSFVKVILLIIVNESKKCFKYTASSSVILVKLYFWFSWNLKADMIEYLIWKNCI